MTPAQRQLIADLLDLASDEFCNHGCNDYPLPDTPENRALWRESHADDDVDEPSVHDGQIYFEDWVLMGHFADMLRKEEP